MSGDNVVSEEVQRLVDAAIRASGHMMTENPSMPRTGPGVLLVAYHAALQRAFADAEKHYSELDPVRLRLAKEICALSGVEANLPVTNMPTIVAKIGDASYSCPVFDYRPHPAWWMVFRNLPATTDAAGEPTP